MIIENNEISFVDLGSSNGSLVNGISVQTKIALKAWDTIQLADTALEIVDTESRKGTKVFSAISEAAIQEDEQAKAESKQANIPAPAIIREEIGYLQLISGDGPQKLPLYSATNIGRAPENDAVISFNMISGNHATIEETDEGVYIVDNNSTNGTHVNGVKTQKHQLYDSDEIAFDIVKYKAVLPDYKKPISVLAKTGIRPIIDVEKTGVRPMTSVQELDPESEKTQATPVTLTENKIIEPAKEKPSLQRSEVANIKPVLAQVNEAEKDVPTKVVENTHKTTEQQVSQSYKPDPTPPPTINKSHNSGVKISDELLKPPSLQDENSGIWWVLTSFDGRIKRKQFWFTAILFMLSTLSINFVAALLSYGNAEVAFQALQLASTMQFSQLNTGYTIFAIFMMFPYWWGMLAIYNKRFHDRGKSGCIKAFLTQAAFLAQVGKNLNPAGYLRE